MPQPKQEYASSLVYKKGGTSSKPLYIADKYPPYQIDFTQVSTGKQIASSKRRIRFRFGFASPTSLDNGCTGVDCRGEEHDIVLVWSISSGKRLLMVDGQEVHYSFNKESKFEFVWSLRGNHTAKITAHSHGSLFGSKEGWKQFDFSLDGMSYFDFVKLHELGVTKKGGAIGYVEDTISPPHHPRDRDYREDNYRNYTLDDDIHQNNHNQPPNHYAYNSQDHDYAPPQQPPPSSRNKPRGIRPVVRTIEFNHHDDARASDISRTDDKSETEISLKSAPAPVTVTPAPAVVEKQDLLDFAFETTSNPIDYTASTPSRGYGTTQHDFIGSNNHNVPQPSFDYAQQPPPAQPSVPYNSYVNNVMHAYNANPATAPPPQDVPPSYQPQPSYQPYPPTPQQPALAITQTPHVATQTHNDNYTYSLSNIDESPHDEHEPVIDNLTRGLSNLVNLEDITQGVENTTTKLTMNSQSVTKDKKHSRGLPPKEVYSYGAQPSLSEIHSSIRHNDAPRKEVMRPSMPPPQQQPMYGNSVPQYARYTY